MVLAPIVLFTYNRLWHTQQTVEALQKNELAQESDLFIYSDGAKDKSSLPIVQEVKKYLKTISGFKSITIIEREKNLGLADSVIEGVSEIVNKFGKIIVLEDDIVTSTYFLKFMNDALKFYKNNKKTLSITAFNINSDFLSFPTNTTNTTYLNPRPMSWSWATWSDVWNKVNWNDDYVKASKNKKILTELNVGGNDLKEMLQLHIRGEVDSWYIRWCYFALTSKLYTVYPIETMIQNIGFDNSGVHCGMDTRGFFSHEERYKQSYLTNFDTNNTFDKQIITQFNKAFNLTYLQKIKISLKDFIRIIKGLRND